jgi:hypothetical protein
VTAVLLDVIRLITLYDVTIELENRLPASLGDVDESYEDDIIFRDATMANAPVRTLAGLHCKTLLRY